MQTPQPVTRGNEEKKDSAYVAGAGWIALRAALDKDAEGNFTYDESQVTELMLKPENRNSDKHLKAAHNNWVTNVRYSFTNNLNKLQQKYPEAKTMEEIVTAAFGSQLEEIDNPFKKEVYEAILVIYPNYTPENFISQALRREN